MKFVICGKGGSGKSTVSALIAQQMASRGEKVLVVDTDESNFGLYKQLGLPQPKDFMDWAKINKPVYFILNRMNEDATELLSLVDGERVIGSVPFDRDVFRACLKGSQVPQLAEMKEIVDRLLAK